MNADERFSRALGVARELYDYGHEMVRTSHRPGTLHGHRWGGETTALLASAIHYLELARKSAAKEKH